MCSELGNSLVTRTMHDVFLPSIANDASNSSAGLSSLPSELHGDDGQLNLLDALRGFSPPRPYHKPPPSLECPYCQLSFTRHFLLNVHVRTHTGHKPYQCMICGRAFAQKAHISRHMMSHKVWTYCLSPSNGDCVKATLKGNEVIVQCCCPYCDCKFEKRTQLMKHLADAHINEKVYECPAKGCLENFEELASLISHLPTHEGQMLYSCPHCTSSFSTLQDVGQHQVSHLFARSTQKKKSQREKRSFACLTCGDSFSSAKSLVRHEATVTHKYNCPKCPKVFANPRRLRKHAQVHNPSAHIPCPQCPATFAYSASLQKHMAVHSNTRQRCPSCPSTFTRVDALRRHVSAVHNTPSLKCPFSPCQAYFSRKDHLNQHLSTHTPKLNISKPVPKKLSKK